MKRSLQYLSHEKDFTCNMGQLVPITHIEVVPGDVFRHDTSLLLRTQPLLAPVMHKVDISIHHWFVPDRILWTDWENFINMGLNGTEAPVYPTITPPEGGFGESTLADYLGIDPSCEIPVSAMPFRAYAEIVNNWYFDEQLQTPLNISRASGPDVTTSTALQNGCWQKDYFTAARPEPQLGTPVSIPLTGNAPVFSNAPVNTGISIFNSSGDPKLMVGTGSAVVISGTDATAGDRLMQADLSDVSAVNINDLRDASAFQRFKEKTNRGGARYTEWLRSMFGVNSQDSRLQLPEYIGGGKQTIQFSEVLQTAEGTSPVGELRGHGISAGKSNRYKFYAPEHGHIITLMCVRPKTSYAQGLNKVWNRRSPFDFLIPDFAHLGDQPIANKEIYSQHSDPDGVFGYTPRYDEYRYIPNSIAGEFRSTLDFWTMFRDFPSDPALNASFVSCNPTDRIYATDAAQLQVRAFHNVKAKRPIPKKATPRLY